MLQRQVSIQMDIDIPMLSKIESGDRKAKKQQVILFAKVLNGDQEELVALWLADQLVEILQGEDLALKAISIAKKKVIINSLQK